MERIIKFASFWILPDFEGKQHYNIPPDKTIDEILMSGTSYYDILEKYGYKLPVMDAINQFFLRNSDIDQEQAYCNLNTNGRTVNPGNRYSCLSDIIELSHKSLLSSGIPHAEDVQRHIYERLYEKPSTEDQYNDDPDYYEDLPDGVNVNENGDYIDDDGNVINYEPGQIPYDEYLRNFNYRREEYIRKHAKYPEVSPEGIKAINSGALCVQDGRIVSCIEKILMRSDYLARIHGNVEYNSRVDHPFVYHLDKYDWSIKTPDGIPAIQSFLNMCSQAVVEGGLPQLVTHLMNSEDKEIKSIRASLMSILEKEYDFRNTKIRNHQVSITDGYNRTTGIDYIVSTGILTHIIISSPLGRDILKVLPLCRYGESDLYPCFAKLLNNSATRYQISNGSKNLYPDSAISPGDYSLFLNALETSPSYRGLFEEGLLESNCAVLSGTDSESPITCMDIFINAISDNCNGSFSQIFYDINAEHPISEMTCIDEKFGGRSINCLDKLIGEAKSNQPINAIEDQDILLDRPICSDHNGTVITCVDKIMQRHELWVYAKYRARQLRKNMKVLESMIDAHATKKFARSELDIILEESKRVVKMINDLTIASGEMNADFDIGIYNLVKNNDVGSLKSHIPSFVTPLFKKVIEDDISDARFIASSDVLQSYLAFDMEHVNYASELIKTANAGKSQEYPMVARIMKMHDANKSLISDYGDYAAIGVTDLMATRAGNLSLNSPVCKNTKTGKNITCIQKLVEVSQDIAKLRKTSGLKPYGYVDEYMSMFAMKDLYKPSLCENGGSTSACIDRMFAAMIDSGSNIDMRSYVTILSNKDFVKSADNVINTKKYGEIAMRDAVCKNVKLFDLAHHLVRTKTLHNNLGNTRPRYDSLALSLHSICKGCDKIKDPFQKRICMDSDCFDENGGFIAGKTIPCNIDNEQGSAYGGYNYSYSGWANEYANDTNVSMSHFRYMGSNDKFGLAGVYRVTYDPTTLSVDVSKTRFDYVGAVGIIYHALRKVAGKKLRRYKDSGRCYNS